MNSGMKTLYVLCHAGEYRFFHTPYDRNQVANLIRLHSYTDIITYFDIPLNYENMQVFLSGMNPCDERDDYER